MDFVPSDAYVIIGHGSEPLVILEHEKKFIPSESKRMAKEEERTIGTISNNGLMDLDDFFIVPNNCMIIAKATPGESTYAHNVVPLINKIGSKENIELSRNPLSNTKKLFNQLGPVSIYKPGDICPNFMYSLFYTKEEIIRQAYKRLYSDFSKEGNHLGLVKTPLRYPHEYKMINSGLIEHMNDVYRESEIPIAQDVIDIILRGISKKNPNIGDILYTDESGKFLDMLLGYFSITQKQLLRIGDDGIAKRPGVYYNFVCRGLPTPNVGKYYKSNYSSHNKNTYKTAKHKIDPAITSIRKQPKYTQLLFNRILNETIRKRKPLVRNSFNGGKRTRKNKRK